MSLCHCTAHHFLCYLCNSSFSADLAFLTKLMADIEQTKHARAAVAMGFGNWVVVAN